jgi:excisionase family DNA binding protein
MRDLKTNPKKAAAKSQAAASRHNQITRPTDRVLARNIVELSERCFYNPVHNLILAGFTPERAFRIFNTYLYAVDTGIHPKFVGGARAATLIGVSRSKVQAMAKTGELKTFKIRKTYRFHERDLLYWIAAQPANPGK